MNIEHDQARQLRELARQSRASQAPGARATTVVTVAGGYPQVGATTVIARLAAELSRQSLRIELQQAGVFRGGQHSDADIVLIDGGAGFSRRTAPMWNQADLVMLVTTNTREAVLATYASLKLANAENLAIPIYLLPNRCANEKAAEVLCRRISESCERFLGTAVPTAPWLPTWHSDDESTIETPNVAKLARFLRDWTLSAPPAELCLHAA